MKERPIIFNGEMILAILEGRKTQTRRPVKQQSYQECRDVVWGEAAKKLSCKQPALTAYAGFLSQGYVSPSYWPCPFGQPGDRLWVRETYLSLCSWDHDTGEDFPKQVMYKASPEESEKKFGDIKNYKGERLIDNIKGWKPSIHMPRWASRIALEITNVRVERVAAIDQASCYLEGMPMDAKESHPTLWFKGVWDSIYAKGPYAWDKNPWVWVVEFRRVQP